MRASAVGSSEWTACPRNEGSSTPSTTSVRRRARLRELPRDPPHLHDGQRRAVGQHGRHLQQHLQALADRDRGDLAERLGAVARLEEEGAPLDRLAERAPQRPRLAGEDERRQLAQPLAHGLDGSGVGPVGLLQRGQRRATRTGVQGSVTAMQSSVSAAVLTPRAKTAKREACPASTATRSSGASTSAAITRGRTLA